MIAQSQPLLVAKIVLICVVLFDKIFLSSLYDLIIEKYIIFAT